MTNNNDITNTRRKDIFSDTSKHTGAWRGVLALSEVTFTSLQDSTLMTGTWDGRTFPIGTFLTGKFTAVELTSGEVCVYA